MSIETSCTKCEKELTGGLDTFGRFGEELCSNCFLNEAEPDTVDCPYCNGKGEVDHKCNCELCDIRFEDCAECDGTGELKKDSVSTREWNKALHESRHLDLLRKSKQHQAELARLNAWNMAVAA